MDDATRDPAKIGTEDGLTARLRRVPPTGPLSDQRLDAICAADVIERLTARAQAAERDLAEARRRRDEWRAKAEGYDDVCRALREKIGDPPPAQLSRFLWAGVAAMERRRAEAAERERDEARALIAACEPWLKDGETPAERIAREFRDCQAMGRMAVAAMKDRDALAAEVARLREALIHLLAWVDAGMNATKPRDPAAIQHARDALSK